MVEEQSPFLPRSGLDSVKNDEGELRPGDKVRLRPLSRADILDLALDGKIATIDSIEQDFEDRVYLAVTVDDDPGRDLGQRLQPGHRFFFGVDEVEQLVPAKAQEHDRRG
jgi:hypothetical protein